MNCGVVKTHDGELVKTMGDSIMAVFASPSDALQAALEIQRRNASVPGALPIRIGLNSGLCCVVAEGERTDYFGATVNLAARVADLSRGGETVMPHA